MVFARDCQNRRGDSACKNHGITGHGNAAKNKHTEAARANRGRDGRDTDGDDRCRANAGQDHPHREGQLDLPERLPGRHAHGARGFQNGGIDAGNTNVGVAENRQQGVKRQSKDSGAGADSADPGHRN